MERWGILEPGITWVSWISGSRRILFTTLWSLHRVDFLLLGIGSPFYVGGKVTITIFPLETRIGCRSTVDACLIGCNLLTAFTGFNSGLTGPAVISAAAGRHKNTLVTFSDCCTDHFKKPRLYFPKIMETPVRFPPRAWKYFFSKLSIYHYLLFCQHPYFLSLFLDLDFSTKNWDL